MDLKKICDFIKPFEGVKLNAYLDSGGVPTIGYGYIKNVKIGDVCTQEQAEALLLSEVEERYNLIFKIVNNRFSDNQMIAFVSFYYNVGLTNQMRERISQDPIDYNDIAASMLLYTKVKGVDLPGLINRRKKEVELFLK